MTRELKLALIVGFSLVLIVTVLVSDHLSKARRQVLAAPSESMPLAMQPEPVAPQVYVPESAAPRREISEPESPPTRAHDPLQPGPVEIAQGSPGIPEGFVPVESTGPVHLIRTSASSPAPVTGNAINEPPTPSERVHVVAEGDTLYQIARQYYGPGADWQKIAHANGIRPESLKVGMKLRVPGVRVAGGAPTTPASSRSNRSEGAETRSPFTMYVVKRGDTLEAISRKMLGTPARLPDLIRANGIEDGDAITIGQTLRIPNS